MAALLTIHQQNECKRVAAGNRYNVAKQVSTGTYVHIVKSSSTDVYFVPFEGGADFRRTL